MANTTVTWTGRTGQRYVYEVLNMNTNWNKVAGNYIFASRNGASWHAIYIGQTNNFAERLPGHEALGCATRNGATHIHAHVNGNEAARIQEEQDLIEGHNPTCNKLLKTG